MQSHTSPCSAVLLRQKQEQNMHHHKQQVEAPVNDSHVNAAKNCTVVENGRVVVKPAQVDDEEAS